MDHTSTITIPSNRIYLEKVDGKYWKSILDTFISFNTMKEWTYNRMYDAEFLGVIKGDNDNQSKNNVTTVKSVSEINNGSDNNKEAFNASKVIREEMNRRYDKDVPGYYVTSIYSTVSGMIKSQKELLPIYERENSLRVEHIEDSIKKDEKLLKHYTDIKASIIDYTKKATKRFGSKKNPKVICKKKKAGSKFRLSKIKTFKDAKPELCPERKDDGTYDMEKLYQYELYIDSMIHTLKARIAQKGHKAMRKGEKYFKTPRRVTFGSHAFYKTKDTKNMDETEISEWHNERNFRRMNIIHISGRHDSPNGNFCCRYNPAEMTMILRCWDGSDAVFSDVKFPYRGHEIIKNLQLTKKNGRKSIGYTIELHIDRKGKAYLLFKATIDIEYTMLNDYVGDGVISVDLNYDNISWSELNKDGCRIAGDTIDFDLLSGKAGHNKDLLGRACTVIATICKDQKKPLAMEDLDTQDAKTKMAYGSKKGNAHASVFAFRTMTTFLENKCAEFGVGVIKNNPAFTSQSGKMKYMRFMNRSIHESASVTIGRRAMGFKEKIPRYLRHLIPQSARSRTSWKHEFYVWGNLTKKFKYVPKSFFKIKHKNNMPLSYYLEHEAT